MPLLTRLNKNDEGNNRASIVDTETGEIIATIRTISPKAEVEITTLPGVHVEKPNGFVGKR